ncbi:MAG: hypothetical protein JSV37_02555 [Anaerolineaceae bacterium]|nr:MAG: hypothetical protein JSV37_02555 [Anaerolineaceae bacterium]
MAKKEVAPLSEVEIPEPGKSLEMTEDVIGKLLDTSGSSVVYGRPIKQGDVTLIPAAEVIAGVGFGSGFLFGQSSEDDDRSMPLAGGAGRTFSRPVAVVIISPEGVRIEPVRDRTKVLLAALTAGGFMAATLLRMINSKRALKELDGK